jgi:hypothetical protein
MELFNLGDAFLRRCWCSGKDDNCFNEIKHQQPTLRLFLNKDPESI